MQDEGTGSSRPADDREAARREGARGRSGGAPRQVLAYVARFDRGEYWLAHEEMEEHWQEHREDLYKGLIQVAAGFLHAERGNWNGSRRLLTTALEYLEPYPETVEGFDLAGIREAVGRVRARVEACAADDGSELDPALLFPMSRYFVPDVPAGVVEDEELPYRVQRYDEGYRPYGSDGPGEDGDE